MPRYTHGKTPTHIIQKDQGTEFPVLWSGLNFQQMLRLKEARKGFQLSTRA